ncbi:MAG: DUF6475 domain-containing protein [Gammaproteobacteria bacterium]
MNKQELIEFAKLMGGIAALCDKDFSQVQAEIYWRSLKRFDFADVKRALQAHVDNPDTGQFLPKPADLIRQLEGSSDDKAYQAWSKVVKTIERIGSYDSVVFDDALIHAVLADMGGWIALCTNRTEQLKFLQHEFQKRYRRYLEQVPTNYPGVLNGVIARDNASAGFDAPAPVFIGDKSKAGQVMQSGGGHRLTTHYPEAAQNNPIDHKNFVSPQVRDE